MVLVGTPLTVYQYWDIDGFLVSEWDTMHENAMSPEWLDEQMPDEGF